MKKQGDNFKNYIRYTGVAFQMAATIILFVLVGQAIDKGRGGESQIFTALLSAFGVFVAIWNLIRSVKKSDE